MPKLPKIAVIDYQSGNLRSVVKALETVGLESIVTSDPVEVTNAAALVLPGVGSGQSAMDSLRRLDLIDPLIDFASSGKPFLGICLGLQLLLENTEEGNAACLGIVSGSVKKLPEGLKVPHMGWNNITFSSNHPILTDIPKDSFFYFVHSYYAEPRDQQAIAGNTHYGLTFCSIYAKDNLVATQFHPEKSGPIGLKIYENFRDITIRNT